MLFLNTNQTRQVDEQIKIELHLVHEDYEIFDNLLLVDLKLNLVVSREIPMKKLYCKPRDHSREHVTTYNYCTRE